MYATLCTVLKELPVRLKQRDHIFAHSEKCESARSASDESLHHLQGRRYFAHSEKCESARSASDKILSTLFKYYVLTFNGKSILFYGINSVIRSSNGKNIKSTEFYDHLYAYSYSSSSSYLWTPFVLR